VDVLSPVEDLSYVISVFIQQLFQLIVRGKKKPFGAVQLGAAPVNGFSPPPRALTGPEPVEGQFYYLRRERLRYDRQ